MITLITGVPGSGKSLYTVAKLLRKLLGSIVTEETDDGEKVQHKRVIYCNIRGLLIDHELVDYDRMKTWHEWCKPGDVFVIDECQKLFLRRPNGAKVPDFVAELEEHRGKHSVDFIVLTQHPMLIDSHLLGLVGRHLHLRRVGNMPMSIVYEWDHTSRSLLYSNAFAKSPWMYDRSAYKLYKSAKAHTSQPKKIPSLLWGVLIGLVAVAYLAPTAYSRLYERTFGGGDAVAPQKAQKPAQTHEAAPGAPIATFGVPGSAQVASAAPAPVLPAAPVSPPGCVITSSSCRCFDQAGTLVPPVPEICAPTGQAPRLGLNGPSSLLQELPAPRDQVADHGDGQTLAWLRSRL